ncbi:MAG: nucleotidyltransferase family protein [Candidatus Poribacteria bacterium]|nr:nucleotidyltransferase family protein [Candidatus Poribacteria bacterium]
MTNAVQERAIDGILRTLRAHLPELREKYHVRELGVFGSYTRDEQTDRSDLDVLVLFDQSPSLFRLMDLEDELQELLGVSVDIAIKSALKPYIGLNILREVIYL